MLWCGISKSCALILITLGAGKSAVPIGGWLGIGTVWPSSSPTRRCVHPLLQRQLPTERYIMLKTQRLWLKRILKPIPRWSPVGVVAVLLTLWMMMADPIAQASEAASVRPTDAALPAPPAETAALVAEQIAEKTESVVPRRSSILHGIVLTDKNAVGPLVKALGLVTLVLLLSGAWLSRFRWSSLSRTPTIRF